MAVRIALRRLVELDALVLSSPPFVVHVPPWVRRTLTWMSRHTPDLRVPHGLAPARISHDRAVVKAYRSDPLVRRSMTAGWRASSTKAAPPRCAKPICCPAAPC